jgi:hypothetical protein
MQAVAHIDPNLVLIIEALVLFFIAAEFIPVISRHLPAWMRSRRPIATTIASATSGLPVPVLDEDSDGGGVAIGDDPNTLQNGNPGKEQ